MLKPIENGEYLHEKLAKYSTIGDYEIKPNDAIAVFVDSVSPANFVAKFLFADLCQCVQKLANNHGVVYPVRIIREATREDDNYYYSFEDSVKNYKESKNAAIAGIQRPLHEKKFSVVVILGECDEGDLKYLKEDGNAMDLHEVLPHSGVYRSLG